MFNQYILILVWIGFMALLQGNFYREEYNELIGDYDWRVKPFFAFLVMLPIIWMAGHRTIYMGDTATYMKVFQNLNLELTKDLLDGKDWGFTVFSIIIKRIIGNNSSLFFLLIAAMQGACLVYVFRKYSYEYVLAIFMFIASTDYISWMFNGIRQFIAVTLIFLATGLMVKKKYIPLLFVILVASTFHQSALLMIPFVIISQGEAWNRRTLFFIIGSLVAILFVERFTTFLDEALSLTQYANVVSDYTSWEDNGTNPLRVLVYSLPAIIAFLGRDRIKSCDDVLINFCANMSIISMGLYLISMVTSGLFIGRLPIYCSLYGYILLPWEIDNIFSISNNKIMKISLIFGYLAFYYYQMHIVYGAF